MIALSMTAKKLRQPSTSRVASRPPDLPNTVREKMSTDMPVRIAKRATVPPAKPSTTTAAAVPTNVFTAP